jgi:hypothetical protein
MHASEVTPEVTRSANRLYWTSDQSVNQIAEDLDLSKGALYGILAPEPSGLGCPLCGSETGFANRTAKERALVECPECAWDGSVDETVSYDASSRERNKADPASGVVPGAPTRRPPHRDGRAPTSPDLDAEAGDETEGGQAPARRALPPLITPRLSTVTKGALIGATVGLVLVLWARRR